MITASIDPNARTELREKRRIEMLQRIHHRAQFQIEEHTIARRKVVSTNNA